MNEDELNTKKRELRNLLKIDEKWEKIAEIEKRMNNVDFWSDREYAECISREYGQLQKDIEEFESANTPEKIEKLELKTLLNGKYDEDAVIMSIHAGAGGTESQDWVGMLLRMYQRFVEKRGGIFTILDESRGEEAGYKSVTIKIDFSYAYGWLRSENGVHRLVRLSPFDADKARHTSFALVEILPQLTHDQDIQIDEKEIRVDVYHAQGHGGQGVNTTDSAVRITHIPSGIVVTCQNERSQTQNKLIAMSVLKSKLLAQQAKDNQNLARELKGGIISAEWGNQIRSYVLHPYQMVKDHRTETEIPNTQSVLDGDLDMFLSSYLKKEAEKE